MIRLDAGTRKVIVRVTDNDVDNAQRARAGARKYAPVWAVYCEDKTRAFGVSFKANKVSPVFDPTGLRADFVPQDVSPAAWLETTGVVTVYEHTEEIPNE